MRNSFGAVGVLRKLTSSTSYLGKTKFSLLKDLRKEGVIGYQLTLVSYAVRGRNLLTTSLFITLLLILYGTIFPDSYSSHRFPTH